jgi:hypothetical protein
LLHLEELQKSYSVNGFPINETVTGISSNGEVLPSGLDKLAAYLDGTDSHENQHEVCSTDPHYNFSDRKYCCHDGRHSIYCMC